MLPTAGYALEDLGEVNMGDPNTLAGFVNWATANYPADNIALVLWNHGSGWRNITLPSLKWICWDDTDGSMLYTKDIKRALNMVDIVPHVIGLDACLMGMIEVAYEIKDTGAQVMVASPIEVPISGWPYDTILAALTSNPTYTPAQFGAVITSLWHQSYSNTGNQAAIDLGRMDLLGNAVSELADTMRTSPSSDPYPVQAAAQAVMNEIETAVIYEKHSQAYDGSKGLAIYFPRTPQELDYAYDEYHLDFAAHTAWDEFLDDFLKSADGSWIELAALGSLRYSYLENADLYDFCHRLANPAQLCAWDYSVDTADMDFEDISTTGLDLGIGFDSYRLCSLPFNFFFYCQPHHQISVDAHGMIHFADASNTYNNTPIPGVSDLDIYSFIAPFWDDINPGKIYYEVRGTAPERRIIVQWDDVWHNLSLNESIDFQVVLYETSNEIRFQYQDVDFGSYLVDQGASATVGIQESSLRGVQYSYNTASLSNGLALRFSPSEETEACETCLCGTAECAECTNCQGMTLSPPGNSVSAKSDKGGCFIATALF